MKKMNTAKGNLLELFQKGHFHIIIHGCNCFHMMGAGIALQIREWYPEAYESDKRTKFGDREKLSTYSSTVTDDGAILNLYTQYGPGQDLSEAALLWGLEKIFQDLPSDMRIGIPAIGCGIAGGDWDKIGPLIDELALKHDTSVTYVEYVRVVDTNLKKMFKGMDPYDMI